MLFTILFLLNQNVYLIAPPSGSEIDVSLGLSGIVWETETQPKINSNIGLAFSYRQKWKNEWWWGGSLFANSYSGDSHYHKGPGALIISAMLYRKIKIDMWTVFFGAGPSSNIVISARNLINDPNSLPDGTYSIIRPGIGGIFQITLIHQIHPYLSVSIGITYNNSYYFDTCWQGPIKDCTEIDPFMQQWFFGTGLIYIFQ